jgi:hypothetical protein
MDMTWTDNAAIKKTAAFVAFCTALVVAGAMGDERYAKAQELVAQASQIKQLESNVQNQIAYSQDMQRKRQAEDYILRYDMTPPQKRSDADTAIANKYRQEVVEINQRWNRPNLQLKRQ